MHDNLITGNKKALGGVKIMNKPVLNLKKKTSVGVHTLPTDAPIYQVNGLVVTHVAFEQGDDKYRNLSVTLEDGTVVPFEWFRTDRYGKKHLETESFQSGLHPLLKGATFRLRSHAVVAPATDVYVAPQAAPKGFYLWQLWDCGMEKDPERRAAALGLASEWWDAYKVYRYTEITTAELLNVHSFEEWTSMQMDVQRAINKRRCSNPNGTDGWRW